MPSSWEPFILSRTSKLSYPPFCMTYSAWDSRMMTSSVPLAPDILTLA